MPPMSAVFPVPGPPVTTVSGRASAASMAALWAAVQRGSSGRRPPARLRRGVGRRPELAREARGERVGEALLEPQVALVVEAAVRRR